MGRQAGKRQGQGNVRKREENKKERRRIKWVRDGIRMQDSEEGIWGTRTA